MPAATPRWPIGKPLTRVQELSRDTRLASPLRGGAPSNGAFVAVGRRDPGGLAGFTLRTTAALERLAPRGEYGLCVECGQAVAPLPPRLAVMPEVEASVACEERRE